MKTYLTLLLPLCLCLAGCMTSTPPTPLKTQVPIKQTPITKESDTMNVIIETNHGTIEVELFNKEAPKTVENFLKYVDQGFYNSTIFHRVIRGFMIQGGGFTSTMKEKETMAPIVNEATNRLPNSVGTLAMARTSVIDSASSQFFINLVNNDFLNHKNTSMQGFGYCVFGKVTKGMDIVTKIETVRTSRAGHHDDVPQEPVEIISIKRVQ